MKQFKKSKKLQATNYNLQSGYITLLSTLFLVVIGGVIAGSVMLLGLGFSKTSFSLLQSNQAKSLANACMEEALQKLRESIYYTGNEILTLTTGTCQIQTISGTGNTNRTITTTSTVSSIVRKVEVVVATVNPTISITSWQEKP